MNNSIKLLIYKSRILELIYRIFWIFPIKSNKIVCSNFDGKTFGESPKFIVEKLKKYNDYLDIVWVNSGVNKCPDYVRTVKPNSIRYLYEIATAKIWIFNSRKKHFIKKRKGQFYVQTWHGCIALKKIEMDVEYMLPKTYIMDAKSDSRDIDIFISSNKVFTNQCGTAFKYFGKVVECGTPKNDILINNEFKNHAKEKIYKELKIDFETKILLYAPTFRENYNCNPYDIDLDKIIEKLEKISNKKWVAVVKYHPKLKDEYKCKYSNKKIMVNNVDGLDISELISSSEIIVTDYSSVMFDSMIAGKKVALYIKDYNDYVDKRGMYIDLDDLPFLKAVNNIDLLDKLNELINQDYVKKYETFKEKIGLNETGKSSEIIANLIINEMKEKNE